MPTVEWLVRMTNRPQRIPFEPWVLNNNGFEFTYNGGDAIVARRGGSEPVLYVFSVPDWVIPSAMDQEAFRVLVLMWQLRNGLVKMERTTP